MITLRRAVQRQREQRNKQIVWLTFFPPDRANPFADGFGSLESLSEHHLPPNAHASRQLHHDAEILTYVRTGALAYEDSAGRTGIIYGGEFQRMTITETVRRSEKNASPTQWAHVFRIWLRPSRDGLTPGYETKRFTTAERSGLLRVVASPDARRESLHLHKEVLIYSALLDPGQHVIHELSPGRGAWLHLVSGQATLGDVLLTTGDGAGILAEPTVSFTAREETEIILLDLPQA